MSWLFSQALVEEYSGGTCLDGEPSAPLNVMPTQHKFWYNGKTMDVSNLSRFGLTYKVLTEDRGKELLKLCREAFLVKTYQQQDSGQESLDQDLGCGQRCPASLEKLNQFTLLLKTPQCLLLEDLQPSFLTLPRWGSMQNGVVSERMPLVHHTKGTGSGSLLPTPSGCRSGKNHVAGRLDEWGGSSNPWRGTEIGKTHTPAFEEWVMGWPVQWTELTQSATDKYQQWLQQHGGC